MSVGRGSISVGDFLTAPMTSLLKSTILPSHINPPESERGLMTRWLLLSCVFLMGFTMIHSKHDTPEKVDEELRNFELGLQQKQMKVFNSTPTLNELQDGEEVIVASNTWATQMFRFNDEIWKVNSSCVTVIR